jgi:hypothetical protein
LWAAAAPAAFAAGSVTTLPANFVTTTSAVVHGLIDTGGQQTSFRFDYGTTTAYPSNTPFQMILPGTPQTYTEATLNQLSPNTTYHFRLLAVFFGIGGNYQEAQAGQDLTFTTLATGRLGLGSTRLRVSGGFASVPLSCRSRLACDGRMSISARAPAHSPGTRPPLVCATKRFSIRPGKSPTILANVSAACRSALGREPNHVLSAQFSANTATGQRGVNRAIKLIG